ncbi:unnamed protein product [Fusarium equiseti]|uniref:Ankyrin n=1 Tax=Fusarium equiseti TaxID=61235 RepID=A0A8J2NC63_FUSEQ|nr:unnamed protein product [Fusarium equiseti]
MFPPQLASGSRYLEFSHDPNADNKHGLVHIHMTMTCQDGTVLYESGDHWDVLLHRIIYYDDDIALKQYLSIAPWAVGSECCDCAENPADRSPFHNAAASGSVKALQVLLAHEKTVTIKPGMFSWRDHGFRLLHEASGHCKIEMVQFLLDNNADIHERDYNGYTALLAAADIYCTEGYREPSIEKSTIIMNMLLDQGASASDIVDPWSWYMDDSASDINEPCSSDVGIPDTVLTLAVQWAGTALVKRVIQGGADVHVKLTKSPRKMGWWPQLKDDFSNVSSLSIASLYLNFDAIEVLLSAGVDITDMSSVQDSTGSLPLHWVTLNYRTRSWTNFSSTLVEQKTQELIRVIELLLEKHPQAINCQDFHGNTPLHHATRHPMRKNKNYTTVIELLCSKGADASLRNKKKKTPLHTLLSRPSSSTNVDTEAIDILVTNGASVTDIDEAGNSPLHLAARGVNHADVITFLLHRGADANLRNAAQDTPLHLAASNTFHSDSCHSSPCCPDPIDEMERLQDNVMTILSKAAGPAGLKNVYSK